MRRLAFALTLLVVGLPIAVWGQSSQFGIRGLGLPGRSLSARAIGMGGSIGVLDPRSVQTMAPMADLDGLVAGLQSLNEWRDVENPGGSGSIRNNRFPLFRIGGPIKRFGVVLGAAASTYTNQDFGVSTQDTILIRGEPVGVLDTLVGIGGLNDLQLGAAYALNRHWSVGAAVHVITGSTRNRVRREFDDPQYRSFRDSTEVAFDGFGFSVSILGELTRTFSFGLLLRSDGNANITSDSTALGQIDLPFTVAASIEWRPSDRFMLGLQGTYQTWSAMNSDLLERGGLGADNTAALAFGGEWGSGSLPLRFGARYGSLPFRLTMDTQPQEVAVSLGTGVNFARGKASIDLAGEYVKRDQGDDWRETAWLLTAGIEIRP